MGLFVLLAALFGTISDTMKENAEHRRQEEERRRYEAIDFHNIAYVTLDGVERAYRTETEEVFDPLKSDFLTRQDGWQHYETETVEYEVEDGENYCFTIRYKNGTEIYRKFHESSPLTQKLLSYCEKQNKEVEEIVTEINNVVSEIGKIFQPTSKVGDYERAVTSFQEMQAFYKLNENSTEEAFEKAAAVSIANLVMSQTEEFNQSLYDLMLYLLSTEEDGDILEKINQDGFTFLQQTDLGVDAFAILEKGKNADSAVVMQYEEARIRGGFRKAVILTTGANTATLSNPNVVIWDVEKICAAYLTAFKRIVTKKKETPQATGKERFAVIDFETTGLNFNFRRPPMDEVISVAIIDQDGNTLLNTLCDTVHQKSWYEAQCIHGISPRMVRGYPTFAELFPKVIEILSSYDYVIAYNVPFEKSFLESYAHLYTPTEFSILKVRWGQDPMEMFMNYMGSRKFLKLENAARHFGYTYHAHNALEDTKATLFVYNALRGQ